MVVVAESGFGNHGPHQDLEALAEQPDIDETQGDREAHQLPASFHGPIFEVLYRGMLALHIAAACFGLHGHLVCREHLPCHPHALEAPPAPSVDTSPVTKTDLGDVRGSSGPEETGIEIKDLQRRVCKIIGSLIRQGLHFLLLPAVVAVCREWGLDLNGPEGIGGFDLDFKVNELSTDVPAGVGEDCKTLAGGFHVHFLLDAVMDAVSYS